MSTIKAFLFNTNGTPEMETQWYCGRMLGRTPSFFWMEESRQEGEVISLHCGHGVFHDYIVLVKDSKEAILQRV